MKTPYIIVFLLFTCALLNAQSNGIEITSKRTNPYASKYPIITLDTLASAKTIKDIYARFPETWIREYLSVDIITNCNTYQKTASGNNEVLTEDQLNLLMEAGDGCQIEILVDYIPENNLTENPPRQMNYTLTKASLYEAKFPGGRSALQTYLDQNIIEPIPKSTFDQIEFAEYTFTISAEGKTTNIEIITSSGNEKIDQFIHDVINKMPYWQNATDMQGLPIPLVFEISLGTDLLLCDYKINQRVKKGGNG